MVKSDGQRSRFVIFLLNWCYVTFFFLKISHNIAIYISAQNGDTNFIKKQILRFLVTIKFTVHLLFFSVAVRDFSFSLFLGYDSRLSALFSLACAIGHNIFAVAYTEAHQRRRLIPYHAAAGAPLFFFLVGRHQTMQTVWMTLPDCVRVAKEVFSDKASLQFRDLIATVEIQARAAYPARARRDEWE